MKILIQFMISFFLKEALLKAPFNNLVTSVIVLIPSISIFQILIRLKLPEVYTIKVWFHGSQW